MNITSPSIVVPKTILALMILAGTTVTEPAPGETLWVIGGTYAEGDTVIRVETHRVYTCVQAHTGRTALPENDSAYWLTSDTKPTQLWAPFDAYTSTAATGTTSMTYVLNIGFANAVLLYGIVGTAYSMMLKDQSGGTLLRSESGSLFEPSTGYYDYYFGQRMARTKLKFLDLPIRPAAELTITITNAPGQPVGIGMINVGNNTPIIGAGANFGGTEYGPKVKPKTNSYIKTDPDGTTKIKRRHSGTDISLTASLPRKKIDGAVLMLQQLLDVPLSLIGSDQAGFDALNNFGLINAEGTYDSFGFGTMQIDSQGMF